MRLKPVLWILIVRVGKASSFYSSLKRRPTTVAEAKKSRKPRTRYISDDFSGLLAENAPRNATAASSAISIPARGMSGADTGSPIISYPFVGELYHSEFFFF